MFANLKNKLIEEVKASPSKLQQFANAAQAAVSSSASTTSGGSESNATNENFFSITEEDTPHNSPLKPPKLSLAALRSRVSAPQGASSNEHGMRTRKLSNSSMASDASFRLPSYDSPAVYHLQSDADFSGSEMDDSASTANLDVVTKERLFAAYKKALDRYTRYRSRYTDLAKKYQDLERDSTKARSVLVETQEKAIRRISELREQCTLEQQAKAHLEEALRVEMDDMHCKMEAYQTKLKLLGENPDNVAAALEGHAPLIDLGSESATAQANGSSAAAGDRITELEEQLKVVTENLAKSTLTIKTLREQEEENALLLAQTKQAIHSELENKEREVKNLTATIKQLQNDMQAAAEKDKRLTEQAEEIKQLHSKVKQSHADKQEADAKIISAEHAISEMKKQIAGTEKALAALEAQHAATSKDNEQKLQDLRQQNSQLNEMVQRYQQKEVTLAEIDNELNRTKNENDILRQTLAAHERLIGELKTVLDEQKQSFAELQAESRNEHEARVKELQEQLQEAQAAAASEAQKAKQLAAQLQILSEQTESNHSETTEALRAELQKANAALEQQLVQSREQLASKAKELKSANNKLAKQKKQFEAQQHKITEQAEEIAKLESEFSGHEAHLQELQETAQAREAQAEAENQELKAQLASILQDITLMEDRLRVLQDAHNALELEKQDLEVRNENMAADAQATAEQLKQLELKLQNVESENSQLAERNCLLEESSHRVEKLLGERERQQVDDESTASEMRLKLETAEDAIQKLNEKMSQVLDENSRMHNAQELMDHDYRTLQDKYDALEKEKLLTEDTINCLRADLERLKAGAAEEASKTLALQQELEQTKAALAVASEQSQTLTAQLKALNAEKAASAKQAEELAAQLKLVQAAQADDDKLRESPEAKQSRIAALERSEQETLQVMAQLNDLSAQLERTEAAHNSELGELKAQNQALQQQSEQLNAQVLALAEQLKEKSQACEEAEAALKPVKQALENAERQLAEFGSKEAQWNLECEKREVAVKDLEAGSQARVQALEAALAVANGDVARLHESNDAVQVELDRLKTGHQLQLEALEKTLQQTRNEHDALKQRMAQQAEGLARITNYDELQLENEYLNKHVKQLESALAAQKASSQSSLQETEEHKQKYKSIQCELYVLKENAEAHTAQLQAKSDEVALHKQQLAALQASLEQERTELQRQTAHAEFLNEQNDQIQKQLLQAQQEIADVQKELLESAVAKETEMAQLSQQKVELAAEVAALKKAVERKAALEQELRNESVQHVSQTEAVKSSQNDAEQLRKPNAALQSELEEPKYNAESANLQQELEDMETHNKQMTERLQQLDGDIKLEKAELEARVKAIMSEVQDVSNRNIFLEQKCENYLIIEQSNERLKLQNAKLSRQLDETLISMQHNEGITANTEFEYLKNIMFQYLTGSSNANNETLVKVISAVLKFSPQQTQVALEKEHQRRSLINKIL